MYRISFAAAQTPAQLWVSFTVKPQKRSARAASPVRPRPALSAARPAAPAPARGLSDKRRCNTSPLRKLLGAPRVLVQPGVSTSPLKVGLPS